MTMYVFKLISLLGGLALFLFGMDVMGKALERQAGGKLQTILAKMSSTVFKGFLLGAAVTAVIQSSSATTVMVVGFVLDDPLTAFERTADHCSNIAVEMLQVSEGKLEAHEYLNALKAGELNESVEFNKRFAKYKAQYAFPEEA